MAQPEMNPDAFEKLCTDAGAENLYHCIKDAICHERMSHERKHLSGIRTMVIIYIMMYSSKWHTDYGDHLYYDVLTIAKVQFISSCSVQDTTAVWHKQ